MQLANASTNQVKGATLGHSLTSLNETLTGKVVLAVAASLFVALCAHISVPLPFTPVPLTLGNMAVVLVGLALGPATAFAALALYLAEGAMGMPVFNPSPLTGIAHLLGPTGGFLFAYPAAAAIAGASHKLLSRILPDFASSLAASTVATCLVLTAGVSWLAVSLHLTPGVAFKLGAAPFVLGEVVKIMATAGIFTSLSRSRSA